MSLWGRAPSILCTEDTMQHQLDMLASVCADETPVIHASSLIAKGDKWDQSLANTQGR